MAKYFISFLVLLSFLTGCTDQTNSPVLTGSMTGFVILYNEDGSEANNFSGVYVTLEGTNHFGVSDSSGKFLIQNVSAGIYNIVFSKEGFGTYKIIAQEFTGGGEAYYGYIYLSKVPSFTVQSISVLDSLFSYIHDIICTLSDTQNYYRNIIAFLGHQNVSEKPADYLTTKGGLINMGSSVGHIYIYREFLLSHGFNVGDSVYVMVYPISNEYSTYPDPNTGRYYYVSLGSDPLRTSFLLK
jgi:hypothetical protein